LPFETRAGLDGFEKAAPSSSELKNWAQGRTLIMSGTIQPSGHAKLDYSFEDSFYYLHKSLPNPPATTFCLLCWGEAKSSQAKRKKDKMESIIHWRGRI